MKESVKHRIEAVFVFLLVLVVCQLFSSKALVDLHIKFVGLGIFLILLIIWGIRSTQLRINFMEPFSQGHLLLYGIFVLYSIFNVFQSGNVEDALFDWFKLFFFFVLIIFFTAFISYKVVMEVLPNAFTVLGFILVLGGLSDVFTLLKRGTIRIPEDTYEIMAHYGHRNLYAQLLFFTLPFVTYKVLYSSRSFWTILSKFTFATSLLLLIILSNRATWLALLAGILVCVTVILWMQKTRKELNGQRMNVKIFRPLIALTILIGTLAFAFYVKFSSLSGIQQHTQNIVNPEAGSTKDRLQLWKKTYSLIKEKPVFGHGLSTWKFEVLKYGDAGLASEDHLTFYHTPHNDFLWVLSEQGFIGLILYLGVFLFLLMAIIKNIWQANDEHEMLFYLLLLTVLMGYVIFSIFSFPKERIEDNIVFCLLFCIVLMKRNTKLISAIRSSGAVNRGIVALFFLLILYGLNIGIARFKGELQLKKALYAKEIGNNEMLLAEIKQARGPYYAIDPFATPFSWYTGSAYFNLGQYNDAMQAFQDAYQRNPYHIHTLNNLASCYVMGGELQKGIDYYNKAIQLSPSFDEARLNLSVVYFNEKRWSEAYLAISAIDPISNIPNYRKFLMVILKAKINEYLQLHPNEAFQDTLSQNLSNENWYHTLHVHVLSHKITIEQYISNYQKTK